MTIAILATLLFQAGALTSESSTGEQVSAVSKPTAEARHWGNLTLAPGVSRPAIIKDDPAWVQGDDRPPGVSDDVHGRTVINFVITPEGRLSNCEIFESSGDQRLDRVTCEIAVRRARFESELDLDGKPMASHGRRGFNW